MAILLPTAAELDFKRGNLKCRGIVQWFRESINAVRCTDDASNRQQLIRMCKREAYGDGRNDREPHRHDHEILAKVIEGSALLGDTTMMRDALNECTSAGIPIVDVHWAVASALRYLPFETAEPWEEPNMPSIIAQKHR